MVLPTTSGAASCPLRKPVSNVYAGSSDETFAAVISVSPLYRELAKSLAGRSHCPSSGAVAAASIDAPVPAAGSSAIVIRCGCCPAVAGGARRASTEQPLAESTLAISAVAKSRTVELPGRVKRVCTI